MLKNQEMAHMDVVRLLETQARAEVRELSSERILSEWLEPMVDELSMTERRFKRILMINTMESVLFGREVVRRMVHEYFDIAGGVTTLVFFTRLVNTRFYASHNDEHIFCVYKDELVYIQSSGSGHRARIHGGAPSFQRVVVNEE